MGRKKMCISHATLFIIVGALLTSASGSSPIDCSSDGNNTACASDGHNLIGSSGGIQNVGQCRSLCQNTKGCQFITYFDENSFPANQLCLMFSSCDTTLPCKHCSSEDPSCYLRCDNNYVGVLNNNVIKTTSLKSETLCFELCRSNASCHFYTYFKESNSVFSELCFLLHNQSGPYQYAEDAVTGPTNCQSNTSSVCSIIVDGEIHQSYLFNDSSADYNVQLLGDDKCEMRILAIGGGGVGDTYGGLGGGSGYLAAEKRSMAGVVNMKVKVGASEGYSSSSSTVELNGEVIVTAKGGGDGSFGYAGDGYSGGGGSFDESNGARHGGSDGEDGEGDSRGDGTGQELTSFKFDNFVLTPGVGGFFNHGGGGGGVVINGGSPPRMHVGVGEGYGAGGEGQTDYNSPLTANGISGAVIIEVVKKD